LGKYWDFTVIWRQSEWKTFVAAFGSSSNFFKSASLLLKGDAIFYAFPSDDERRNSLVWGENAKHAFRPRRTRTKRTFGGAATTKASAPGKTKETFPFETRALWKLVPLRRMYNGTLGIFEAFHTHPARECAIAFFCSSFWREMKTHSVAKGEWVMATHLLLPFTHRENSSPHALLWA
jgi:hypothetical protein